mgnify:FL=1
MEYTLTAGLYDCITLRVATKFFNTKEGATASTENLALVGALLLTMVTITGSSEVGDKIFFVDEQTAESVYVGLSFLAQSGFFLSTIASSAALIFSSFCDTDEEFIAFLSELGYLWKITLGTFLYGFFAWIFATFWLLISLLGPLVACLLAFPPLSILGVTLFGFVHSTQTISRIRAHLSGERMTSLMADTPEDAAPETAPAPAPASALES